MHEWTCTPTIHHIPRLLLNRPSPLPLSSSKWVFQSSACHLSLCWWCPASIYCLLIDWWTLQMLCFTCFSCWRDITALPIPPLRKVICKDYLNIFHTLDCNSSKNVLQGDINLILHIFMSYMQATNYVLIGHVSQWEPNLQVLRGFGKPNMWKNN